MTTSLSTIEFDTLWRGLAAGDPPAIMGMRTSAYPCIDPDDVQDTGSVSGLLEVLARARVSVELRGWDGGELRAVAGRTGQRATLLVLRDGVLRVSAVPVTGLAEGIVGVLPARVAGPGHPVTVATSAWAAAAAVGDQDAVRDALRLKGLSDDDARTLLTMAGGCDRFWQFDAAVRGRDGTSHRAPRVLTVRGDEHRTYLLTRRITAERDDLTLAPADTATIEASIAELVADLVRTQWTDDQVSGSSNASTSQVRR